MITSELIEQNLKKVNILILADKDTKDWKTDYSL